MLLNTENAKTPKGVKHGWLTAVLYLAPANLSGYEVCPMRTAGCTAACLNTAGRGRMTMVQEARVRKTRAYFEDRVAFMGDLVAEIKAHERRAIRAGLRLCVRLNGTSDIVWERVTPNVMALFPAIQFYDYTKRVGRAMKKGFPPNYDLTFSASGEESALKALRQGERVAIVMREARDLWHGWRVISGDDDDLRFLDPQGVAVRLKPKGKAKQDKSGFVVP